MLRLMIWRSEDTSEEGGGAGYVGEFTRRSREEWQTLHPEIVSLFCIPDDNPDLAEGFEELSDLLDSMDSDTRTQIAQIGGWAIDFAIAAINRHGGSVH